MAEHPKSKSISVLPTRWVTLYQASPTRAHFVNVFRKSLNVSRKAHELAEEKAKKHREAQAASASGGSGDTKEPDGKCGEGKCDKSKDEKKSKESAKECKKKK